MKMTVIDESASAEQIARLWEYLKRREQHVSTFQERFQDVFDTYATAQSSGSCEETAAALTDAENQGDYIINTMTEDFLHSVIDYLMWVYGQEMAPLLTSGRTKLSTVIAALNAMIDEKMQDFRRNQERRDRPHCGSLCSP